MATTHEGISDTDQGHNAQNTDPKIAEIMNRFGVSEATADFISPLDDGGIHAGGGAPMEWREPKFSGVTAGTNEAWVTARDKVSGNYSVMSALVHQISSVGAESKDGVRSFGSDGPDMARLTAAGLTMEEARDFVVYSTTLGKDVKPKPTEILAPEAPHPDNPTMLLGKGSYKETDGSLKTLEVVTTLGTDGTAIGFSVASRPWNRETDGGINS